VAVGGPCAPLMPGVMRLLLSANRDLTMDITQIVNLIASCATIAAAAVVMLTVRIGYDQLKAMTKASQLESVLKVLEYVDNIDLRHARYFAYNHPECFSQFPADPFSWQGWTQLDEKIKALNENPEHRIGLHQIDLWINALNNIGFLIRYEYAPKEILTEHMWNTYSHCWETFRPYINYRKNRDDSLSMYAQHFEWVATEHIGLAQLPKTMSERALNTAA